MFRLLFFLLIAATANATSVSPVLHQCPVCGLKSVTISLNSYSQFGEPARDLSDSPRFRFANVDVCPGDLYASWDDVWETVDAEEKAELAAFLKEPALHLTDAEKTSIAGHEKDFRESVWFKPLWARTCDESRHADGRRKFLTSMWLHYEGSRRDDGKDWEKSLITLFRENAIAALKDSLTADWPKPEEKRVFAYLRAELTRQAGRNEEAFALFQQIIASEKAAKPDKKIAWISRWASDQGLRASPDAKDPQKLLAAIIPKLPDPWRDKNADGDPRWPLHFAAVDILASRSAAGEKAFSEALWKLLDRKPERLLALLETINSDISALRPVDPRWREWFDEIASGLEKGKLPPSLANDPNDTRVTNVLRRAVGDKDDGKKWRRDVLMPAIEKAVAGGGIPDLKIPKDDEIPNLPPPNEDEETAGGQKKEPTLNPLARELYKLWKESPPSTHPSIARIYIRILRKLKEEYESTDYPVMYFLPEIAESDEGRAAIRQELDGQWVSSYWKAACAYAARLPDTSKAFIDHPFTKQAGDDLSVKLLVQRSDASWKDGAIQKLNESEWTSSELVEYLTTLDLPETRAALERVATEIRNRKPGRGESRMDGRLSTLEDIDSNRVKIRLAALPIH